MASDGRHKTLYSRQNLSDGEHSKDHLSGETDRAAERSVGGKLIHERSTERRTQPDISPRNATKPINNRAGTVRATWSRSTHQRQANQLARSIMGTSTMTAVVSPRRGANRRTRMVPRIKPIRKPTIA